MKHVDTKRNGRYNEHNNYLGSDNVSKLLTVKELGEQLSLSRSTIYRLRKNSDFPFYEVGTRVLFDPDEVMEWIKKNKKQKA